MRVKIRTFLALLVFLLLSVPASLHLYGVWLACLIVRARPVTRRRLGGAWRGWWADVALSVVARCLGLRLRIDAAGVHQALGGRPVLVVANHRHAFDILLIAALMRRLGLPQTRWVLKRQLRHRALFIGHSCIMTECAFVGRRGEDADIGEVARVAQVAGEDRASVVLFPEGTRFRPAKTKDGYRHVLPPKSGGFEALRRRLPDYPIMTVVLDWDGREGTTVLEGEGLVGKELRVTCRLHRAKATGSDAAAWLHGEWRAMDDLLDARAS